MLVDDEFLAIETERVRAWDSYRTDGQRLPGVDRDLAPRPQDNGKKSSWAYDVESESVSSDSMGTSHVDRLFHAAGFLLRRQARSRSTSRIQMVCLRRKDLPLPVESDRAPHPLIGLDDSHRSIVTGAWFQRGDRLPDLPGHAISLFQVSREELIPLLRQLLDGGHIHEEFSAHARELIAQSDR